MKRLISLAAGVLVLAQSPGCSVESVEFAQAPGDAGDDASNDDATDHDATDDDAGNGEDDDATDDDLPFGNLPVGGRGGSLSNEECASRWTDKTTQIDSFNDACSLEYWETRGRDVLAPPYWTEEGLRLEVEPNAPEDSTVWWQDKEGPSVTQRIEALGFIAMTEVAIKTTRLDGVDTTGSFQIAGLVAATPEPSPRDWLFTGVGSVNGANDSCPTDDGTATVGFGQYNKFTVDGLSHRCVGPSLARRVQIAICRYGTRIAAYQRPVRDVPLPADRNWEITYSGFNAEFEGALIVGPAVSVWQQPGEIVANFPWVAITTEDVDSFEACQLSNIQERFGGGGLLN